MKAVILLAIFVAAVAAESLDFPCPQKDRPSGKTDCSYYCELNGQWQLGKYQSGLPCDYNSQGDGICREGLCYYNEKGSSSTQNRGSSRNQPEEDEEWDRK
uniref:Acid tail salivary protein n=1 Tax=Ornithodoros parkeri TaxID=140564 RepID=A6N9M2_ORNPR|nr:acid tail salivary protein [Ornithodoros parkeri]